MQELTSEEACELICNILANAGEVEDMMAKAQRSEITLEELDKTLDKIVEDKMGEEIKKIRNEELN